MVNNSKDVSLVQENFCGLFDVRGCGIHSFSVAFERIIILHKILVKLHPVDDSS